MINDINEIRALATKYSVEQLRNLADLKLLDPIKAVMAGNMINHIQKQNAKPPSTSVAQDLLGIQQPIPMQGQQQPMPPQQQAPQQPPQQPPQMAQAPAGIESLPAGDVGNYAGGGIVAFGEGGLNDNEYYGLPIGGSGRSGSEGYWNRPVMPYGEQMRNVGSSIINGLRRIISDPAMDEKDRAEAKAKLNALTVEPPVSPAYPDESRRGSASFAPINTPPAAPLAPPRRDAPPPALTASKPIQAPTLGDFNPNAIPLTSATRPPVTKVEELAELKKQREAAEEAEGFNKNLTKEQLDRLGVKEKKLEDFESRAGGEALFNFGLGLLGAKQGREFETVGKSGQAALSAYKNDVKDLRAAKEKLDERGEALRLADNQAKKTNSATDIAKRDTQQAKYDAQQMDFYKTESDLKKTEAQVNASVYGTKAQAATSAYTAELSAQTQREVAKLNAETQRWVASRPPAEILAIEEVARRTGKPFDQAMKDFYGSRYGARNVYTREEAMRDARKNLENQAIVNPTDAQMQAEINKLMRIYGGDSGGGGTLQPGPNGTQTYVPRQ